MAFLAATGATCAALCALALLCAPAARTAPVNDIVADFTWAPASPSTGQSVTFTASATLPDGVVAESWSWDFDGDGTPDGQGQTAGWSYGSPGTANVTLRVTGTGEHYGEATHAVTAHSPAGGGGSRKAPVASFTISPAAPIVNQPVLFTSTSSDPDGKIKDQAWDLNGDANFDNGGGPTALRRFRGRATTWSGCA